MCMSKLFQNENAIMGLLPCQWAHGEQAKSKISQNENAVMGLQIVRLAYVVVLVGYGVLC